MNNTKSSRLSIKYIKPANFRVFLKQRSHLSDVSLPASAQNPLAVNRLSDRPLQLPVKRESISKMKDYVRARINMENTAASQSRPNNKEGVTHRDSVMSSTAMDKFAASHKDLAGSTLSGLNRQLSNSQPRQTESLKPGLPSLKSLQQKAEGLLLQKLQHCSTHKATANYELEQSVRELIREIREVEANPEGGSCSAVSLINSKIQLFEKLMAENMAEGDIMRKHLLSRIANKAKTRRLKTEANPCKNSQYSYRDTEASRQVVVNTSVNQECFRTPAAPAYQIYRHRPELFNADRLRQPLPRSSYRRDFLLYDQVPESGIVPTGNVIMGRSSSAHMFHSSYRESFGPKCTSRVNIRDLDACRDKIKNIPINFGGRTRTDSGMLHYDICREASQTKRYEQSPKVRVSSKYLLTESRRQFTREAFSPSQSSIKHENLQKLRYQYKNILHA